MSHQGEEVSSQMIIAEEELFTDFTSATEWEIFTSKLEEILLSWQLSLKDKEETTKTPVRINGDWKSQSEDINFAGYPFIVTHHWTAAGDFIEDPIPQGKSELGTQVNKGSQVFLSLMDATSDFNLCTNCHSLSKFYGLGDFVVISPAGNEMLTTESRIHLVYSSILMAVNSIQCRVPIFLQAHSKSQQLYQGVFEEKNLLVDFQIVHLKRIPPQCNHLSGLLEIFKEKIGSSSLECVDVSVSLTFSVSGMTGVDEENWPQAPPSLDNLEIVEIFPLGKLGFGATKDPIKEIQVSSIWQSLNEDVVVDSEVYTDLDPVQAPLWTVHLELNDQVGSMLIKNLCTILDYCRATATTEQLLGKNYTVLQSPDSPEYELALGALTKERGGYSLISSKSLFSTSKPTKTGGPIPEKTLVVLLNFLFPDAEGDVTKQTHPYPVQFLSDFPTTFSDDSSWKDLFQSFKSCPVESLVWRLGMVVVYTAAHLNGLESLAHLWHEIVLEFRYRWENGYAIPGIESGTPDLNYCLFYQKLQMLNCCINHKKNKESGPPPEVDTTFGGEEDEFFDATETAGEEEVPLKQHSAWNQPQGRKDRTKMRLLRSGEFLYNPVTQDGCPMTEDMIIEMTEMMEQLGQDSEGSELRARILSASLLSDMESFKAANPGAEIEDFVRWHSPRDWIDEEPLTTSDGKKTESGHLSARMRAPGNLWLEMWNVAKPIAAWRQRRLFNESKEAEKILHSFSSMKVSQVLSLLLPSIFHASVCRLLEELASTTLSETLGTCRKIVSRIVQILRNSPLDLDQYEDLLSWYQQVEVRVSQFNSLRRKMTNSGSKDTDAFISNLMMDGNLSLPGGSHTEIGSILLRALEKSRRENTTSRLPAPIKKEFILRTKARRMGSGSTPSCQRMYCCVDQDSFRLAGAFTHDTMFY